MPEAAELAWPAAPDGFLAIAAEGNRDNETARVSVNDPLALKLFYRIPLAHAHPA
jgi:hypothetical protein